MGTLSAGARQQLEQIIGRMRGDDRVALGAVERADLRIEESKVMRDLGDGRDGGVAARAREALLERDRRRYAGDAVDVRTWQRRQELARVRGEGLHESALAFGEDHVERERGLARAARAGDDAQ